MNQTNERSVGANSATPPALPSTHVYAAEPVTEGMPPAWNRQMLGYAQADRPRPKLWTTVGVLSIIFALLGGFSVLSTPTVYSALALSLLIQPVPAPPPVVVTAVPLEAAPAGDPQEGAAAATPAGVPGTGEASTADQGTGQPGAPLPMTPGVGGLPSTLTGVPIDGASLTAGELALVTTTLTQLFNPPLSPADQARLSAALSASKLPISRPADGSPLTAAVISGQVAGSGAPGTMLIFNGMGTLTVHPTEVSVTVQDPSWTQTEIRSFYANGSKTQIVQTNGFRGSRQLSGGVVVPAIVVEVAMMLLAVVLLIAGILVFTGSRHALATHRIWAWVKIGVVIVSTVPAYLLISLIVSASSSTITTTAIDGGVTTTGSNEPTGLLIGYVAASALISLAYPVAVLLVTRRRSVREYCAQ